MRKRALFLTSAAAVAMTIYSAAMSPMGAGTAAAAPPDTNVGIRVPLAAALRTCDFGRGPNLFWGKTSIGQGEALIHRSGNTVFAEIQFLNSRAIGMHYDVGLIQLPRAASPPCGPGAPGTVYGSMDIDGTGHGTLTLQDAIQSGTTGVWVKMERPSPRSQDPEEYYSSTFVPHI